MVKAPSRRNGWWWASDAFKAGSSLIQAAKPIHDPTRDLIQAACHNVHSCQATSAIAARPGWLTDPETTLFSGRAVVKLGELSAEAGRVARWLSANSSTAVAGASSTVWEAATFSSMHEMKKQALRAVLLNRTLTMVEVKPPLWDSQSIPAQLQLYITVQVMYMSGGFDVDSYRKGPAMRIVQMSVPFPCSRS